MAHSDEQADSKTLDSIKDDLVLLQGEIEQISANIQRQRDLEDEHVNMANSAASTQTWMSILKMVVVIAICMGQVFMKT